MNLSIYVKKIILKLYKTFCIFLFGTLGHSFIFAVNLYIDIWYTKNWKKMTDKYKNGQKI